MSFNQYSNLLIISDKECSWVTDLTETLTESSTTVGTGQLRMTQSYLESKAKEGKSATKLPEDTRVRLLSRESMSGLEPWNVHCRGIPEVG